MQFLVKKKTLASVDSSRSWARFCFRYLLLGLVVSLTSAHIAVANPNMFLNRAEINAIKVKVDAGEQPWTGAYSRVLAAANTALGQGPVSVAFQGGGSNRNRYFTKPPGPGVDRGDYFAAIRLGDAVRDLGLAYAFTGEARYADKAIGFIRTWSLDSSTRMIPIPGNRIETYITLPGYYYGADLISDYTGWDPLEKTGFENWVQDMGNFVKANGEGPNNFSNWRTVMLASTGALLEDDSYLDLAESEWKRLIALQMKGVGSSVAGQLGQEVGRSQGLHYSLFALNAMIQGAEILNKNGVNVYDYVGTAVVGGGPTSLKLALDFITPYALNPETWGRTPETRGRTQTSPITANNSMALFELAYSYYQDPDYLAVINRWGRSMDDIRTMGITTLTHGNTFDLNFVPEPSTGLMVAMCCGVCTMWRRRSYERKKD